MSEKLLNNNALAALAKRAAPPVLSAIKNASARTGVNFAYLMEQAAAESSFDPRARARTSSATGLYQFIESTWLNMVKKHGEKHGMGHLAAKIDENGRVADQQVRRHILDLRKDPEKAAVLAAEFAADNKRHLERHVGGEIGATELYFAHFMGASGATGFLNALKDNPLQTAADLFPKAARANRNVFYDRETGEARTLAGVYEFFDRKFGASDGKTMAAQPEIAAETKAPRRLRPPVPVSSFAPSFGVTASSFEAMPAQAALRLLQPVSSSGRSHDLSPSFFEPRALLLNPAELMLMAQRQMAGVDESRR